MLPDLSMDDQVWAYDGLYVMLCKLGCVYDLLGYAASLFNIQNSFTGLYKSLRYLHDRV